MTPEQLRELVPGDDERSRQIRAAFAELDAERARLMAVIDASPMSISVVEGPDHRTVLLNRNVREMLGTSMIGKTATEIISGRNSMLDAMDRVYATGVSENIADQPAYISKDTFASRYYTRFMTPLRDAAGNTTGVVITAYEVTEDVIARHLSAAHEAQLQRVVAMLEESPVLMAVLDGPDMRVDRMNRRMRERVGGELVGVAIRGYVPAGNTTLATLDRVYATGVPETLDIRAVLFEGATFTVTIVPIREPSGTITGLMVTAVEITEQLRARSALEEQARHLEAARQEAIEAGRAKDQFLAMLGHELRNPLAPMVTALQVMRQRGISSPEQELLERQVAHVTRLVDDLLDISRITRGMVILEKRDLEVKTIIDRAIEMTTPLLEQRHHRIETDITYAGLYIAGDVDRLAQVVANLITNAAKYSEPGSKITLAAQRIGARVHLAVADHGVGIAPEMLAAIFDAFVQQPQTLERSHGGLGLGLAIAKNLVEAHGGTIRAHSDGVGKGSTFSIELPGIDRPRAMVVAPPRRTDATIAPKRILIVDDNWEAADILRIALEGYGHTTLIAHDGPSALEAARTFAPELGLLDIGLPVMDGYRLAELLHAAHDIPLVAVTGYGQATDRQRALAAGFASHLVKPVDIHDLASLVDELCGTNPS